MTMLVGFLIGICVSLLFTIVSLTRQIHQINIDLLQIADINYGLTVKTNSLWDVIAEHKKDHI